MGLSMPPVTKAITSSLPANKQGVASALNDVTHEFGTALGVALLEAVFGTGYSAAIMPQLAGVPPELATIAARGIATALELANEGGIHAEILRQTAKDAFVSGWVQAMWAGVVVMGLLFAFVAIRGPKASTLTKETPNET
ncbi:hypothetical protein [Roseobacter sp. GAI101]|uniref:hypothetical protein n=1 Tax=Roseobacter sp. (strain GAI101) TaxID=391589 RepID=UPI0018DB5242|nr:hypothetical protein [Roseobacter sp. GAI101]